MKIRNLSTNAKIVMPNNESISKNIKRQRNENISSIAFNETDIPDVLKVDNNGMLFLQKDTGFKDENRIIIFAST